MLRGPETRSPLLGLAPVIPYPNSLLLLFPISLAQNPPIAPRRALSFPILTCSFTSLSFFVHKLSFTRKTTTTVQQQSLLALEAPAYPQKTTKALTCATRLLDRIGEQSRPDTDKATPLRLLAYSP
ncbi:hypothetical protein BJ508DRAFT_6631 [Ascobolus immersus RN42]|uniref:Uncharacterized protein n=1 Tax=Ascobolus immersus RN42 TaxID=1160509 RepID=A0A3N4IGM9_ASCIM|nr:hypothetical protein BJ508DRAFT_6631 [Ascobolus immersus RN42]